MKTSVVGYPRIGASRELKFASEKYFKKEITAEYRSGAVPRPGTERNGYIFRNGAGLPGHMWRRESARDEKVVQYELPLYCPRG